MKVENKNKVYRITDPLKSTYLFLALFFMPLLVSAKDINEMVLAIWLSDGGKSYISLNSQPKINFSNGLLSVTYVGEEIEFPEESVIKFTYEDLSSVGLLPEYNKVIFDGEFIIIKGYGQTINIITLSGILVKSQTAMPSGDTIIATNDLDTGIYILQIGDHKIKYIKK